MRPPLMHDRMPQEALKTQPRLSAIVIAKDEEAHIADCLSTLHFCDEIVVVDGGSRDRTVELARGFTDRVYITEWLGFSEAKSFAMHQAMGDWILWIDADERVPEPLAHEIREKITSGKEVVGYRMARRAYFLGRWIRHGGWYPGCVLRLFRKECGRFDSVRVHERVLLNGPIGTLENDLVHLTDETIAHYFEKLNRYTSLAAEDLMEKGRRCGFWDWLFRPFFIFLKMYVLKAGFLDGAQGFLLALFSASYVLVKYAKVWELQRGRPT